jgi:hypothetical protein
MACGRGCSAEEHRRLAAMSQDERNAWVRGQAAEAGPAVVVEDRVGTDDVTYTAFWIGRPEWFSALEWSPPCRAERVRADDLPETPGCLVVTRDDGPLIPRKIVAVVEAARLRDAVPPVFEPERGAWVRWASSDDPDELAAALAGHLQPDSVATTRPAPASARR